MTQAIVDASGNYLGSVADGAALPATAPTGAQLVPNPPASAPAQLVDGAWVYPAPATPAQLVAAYAADPTDVNAMMWRGLIVLLAQKLNLTTAQILQAIINAAS